MSDIIRPTCEVPIRWVNDPGSFGPLAVTCGQSVGVHSWTDAGGEAHHACHLHVETRLHRYPPGYPESADPLTAAKAEAFR